MTRNRTIAALAAGLGLWVVLAGAVSAQPAASPVVQTDSGPIRGVETPDGGAVFRAIPFAKPPLGPLRWRAPEPAEPWSEVRDAISTAPACLQRDIGWNHVFAVRQSEDCLYLDVVTPRLDAGARLPVMVWIHGGANLAGGMGDTVTSPMVRRGVVLVAIQYRLGALGFVSLPALTAEQGGASGNYALMDQIAALTWVKANIARFGGDPDKVTIFGESAGAEDVGLLTLAPSTEGLFAREIQESGTASFGLPPRSLKENEALGEQFARLAGAPAGDGALEALRALPPAQILAAQAALQAPMADFVWLNAVVDGRVLTQAPAEILASSRPLRPLLIGSNAREIDFLRDADVAKALATTWGEDGRAAWKLYAADPDPRFGDVALQAASDGMFRCPTDFTAKAFVKAGMPVWVYLFDLPNHAPVSHSTELPFVFDDLPAGPAGVTLQAYWTNFAKTGDPNGPGLPQWPGFGEARAYLGFEPAGPAAGRDLRGAICERLGRP